MRDFYVNLGTYDSAGADQAIASLRKNEMAITRQTTATGQCIVRAGPYTNYLTAKAAQMKLTDQFPQSQIEP
jgi:hypothetical protein